MVVLSINLNSSDIDGFGLTTKEPKAEVEIKKNKIIKIIEFVSLEKSRSQII